MRLFLFTFFFAASFPCLNAQAEICSHYFVAGITELPAEPDLGLDARLRVAVSVDSFFTQWGVGGYVSFVLVDESGDSLTQVTGPDHFLPGNPEDTTSYELWLNQGLTTLPLHFRGALQSTHPFCSIPIDQSPSSSSDGSAEIVDLEVFPNPARSWVKVSARQLAAVRLFNLQGELLLQQKSQTDELELALAAWPRQLLFLQLINTEGASKVVPLIMQ